MSDYDKMIWGKQLTADGLSLQVSKSPWNSVEIRIEVGALHTEEKATGYSSFHLFLKPEEVDALIERLKIAKDAI